MATLFVPVTEDYRDGIPVLPANVTDIVFTNVASATATFGSDQFGAGLISNSVVITGNSLVNRITVFMSATGTFSAAGWSFSSWTGQDSVSLIGTSGGDTITGATSFRNGLNGGGGADILTGGSESDSFVYVGSGDVVSGEQIHGGDGDQDSIAIGGGTSQDFSLATISSIERLLFNDGSSSIATFGQTQIGGSGISEVNGGAGANGIVVNGNNIDLSGVTFTDWTAGVDSATLFGTNSAVNLLTGGSGSDFFFGTGNSIDFMRGGGGADGFNGGGGDDVFIYGAAGEVVSGEALLGGLDDDEIRLTNAGSNDFSLATISDVETLDFLNGASTAIFRGNQIGTGLGLITAVSGGAGVDTLIVNAASGATVNLSGVAFTAWTNGTDSITINGTIAAETLNGSDQNDTFNSSGGADTFNGNDGDDAFVFTNTAHATAIASVNGGNGTDTIESVNGQFNFLNETLNSIERVRFGAAFSASMIFSSADVGAGGIASVVDAGIGRSNTFSVTGANVDLSGVSFTNWNVGAGQDTVLVNAVGNGTLIGSNQNDIFQVGSGNQSLTGGGGSDTMRYQSPTPNGLDIFNDFAAGAGSDDVIDLRIFTDIDRLSDVLARATEVGANTVIDLGGGQTLTLNNVSKASLHADDFLLAGFFGDPAFAIDTFGASLAAGGWSSQDQYPRTAADVNGDGRADLVGFGDAATFVSLANANGTFQNPIVGINSFGFSPAGGSFTSNNQYPRTLGDVNGDGRADIVGFGDAATFVALGNADGTFQAPIVGINSFGFSPAGGGFSSNDKYPRTVGDVNGDGRADIVGFGDAGVFVALGNANGTFQSPIFALNAFGFSPAGGGFTSNDKYPRTVGDVNGDGRADIVGFGDAGVFVALGNANGTFQSPIFALDAFGFSPAAGGFTSDDTFPRRVADVNDDGLADIVGFGDAGVFVSLSFGNGTFAAPVLDLLSFGPNAGGWSGNDRYPRTLADIDADGRAEIVGFGDAGVFIA